MFGTSIFESCESIPMIGDFTSNELSILCNYYHFTGKTFLNFESWHFFPFRTVSGKHHSKKRETNHCLFDAYNFLCDLALRLLKCVGLISEQKHRQLIDRRWSAYMSIKTRLELFCLPCPLSTKVISSRWMLHFSANSIVELSSVRVHMKLLQIGNLWKFYSLHTHFWKRHGDKTLFRNAFLVLFSLSGIQSSPFCYCNNAN